IHALRREVQRRRTRATLRQRLIVAVRPLRIGVPDDQQARVGILVETRGEVLQIRRRLGLDPIRVVVEEQTRWEGDLDALADALDDRARDVLFQLLRLLVYLVADHRADRSAHDGAENRAFG